MERAHLPNNEEQLRRIHAFGIVVESGKRTVLNLKMNAGQELEEVGKPPIGLEKFVVVADELARLQAQIDDLKKK